MANHDINAPNRHRFPLCQFDASPDALAYYTNFICRSTAPRPGSPTYVHGAPARLADFKACAGTGSRAWPTTPLTARRAFPLPRFQPVSRPDKHRVQAGAADLPPPTRAGRLSSTIIGLQCRRESLHAPADARPHPLLEKSGVDLVLSATSTPTSAPARFVSPRAPDRAAHLHEATPIPVISRWTAV